MITDLAAFRKAREELRLRVIKTYKDEITDWCHHALAIELTSEKTGVIERDVQRIIDAAGNLWGS